MEKTLQTNLRMKTKDTIKILEQQLNEAPHSPQLWEDLADLYLQREELDKAIDAYEFALAIEPERESALCKRSIAYLASDNQQLQQKGRNFLQDYCKRHPEKTDLRHILESINTLDETGYNFLPFDDDEILHALQGENEHTKNETKDKEVELDWSMLLNPATPFDDYMDTIDMLYEKRQYNKAIEVLERLIAIHPEEGILYLDCGLMFLEKDMLEEAESYFEKALLKAKSEEDKEFFLGEIATHYFCKQYYLDAIDYYHRIRDPHEVDEQLPYMAACCLELNYPKLYETYVRQLDPEGYEDHYKNIIRAFYGHLPMNLRPDEMKAFLLKLFDRYNS